mgnify:CR=1 FL=1
MGVVLWMTGKRMQGGGWLGHQCCSWAARAARGGVSSEVDNTICYDQGDERRSCALDVVTVVPGFVSILTLVGSSIVPNHGRRAGERDVWMRISKADTANLKTVVPEDVDDVEKKAQGYGISIIERRSHICMRL